MKKNLLSPLRWNLICNHSKTVELIFSNENTKKCEVEDKPNKIDHKILQILMGVEE